MATSLLKTLELQDVPSSGTKRTKLKRLFSSLSGGPSSEIKSSEENMLLNYETPPTPTDMGDMSPTRHALKRVKFFFIKHWNKADCNALAGNITSNSNYSVGDFSCYNKYKTDGDQLERLFNEAVVQKNPPVTRDEILRKMVPFDAMDPIHANNWIKDIQDFNITFSPVDNESSIPFQKICASREEEDAEGEQLARIIDSADTKSIDYEYGNPSALPELLFGLDSVPTVSGKDSPLEKTSPHLISEHSALRLNSERSLKNRGSTIYKSNTAHEGLTSSPDSNLQQVIIPTFREEAGLEVHSIAGNLQVGTITEYDLMKLASSKRKSFMDANFYEERSDDIAECELSESSEKSPVQSLTDYKIVTSKNDTVKFNKYSYLVIYDASKKCLYSESTDKLTLRIPNSDPDLMLANSFDNAVEGAANIEKQKSILKRRTNEQEMIEEERAKKCDEVDAKDFLQFVEKHENQKRKGEHVLALARERQLLNYYDDEYFPSIQIRKDKASFSDFEDQYNRISGLSSF